MCSNNSSQLQKQLLPLQEQLLLQLHKQLLQFQHQLVLQLQKQLLQLQKQHFVILIVHVPVKYLNIWYMLQTHLDFDVDSNIVHN